MEGKGGAGALCLSLIISLIISQIRSKYLNSSLINCAPQGVWRPAGLVIRVEGREHKCKKMHIWCYLLNEQCRKTWGSGLLEAIFPLIKFTFLNQFSVGWERFLSFITFECGNICNNVGYQCTFSVLAAHVNDNCRKSFLWNISGPFHRYFLFILPIVPNLNRFFIAYLALFCILGHKWASLM